MSRGRMRNGHTLRLYRFHRDFAKGRWLRAFRHLNLTEQSRHGIDALFLGDGGTKFSRWMTAADGQRFNRMIDRALVVRQRTDTPLFFLMRNTPR